MDGEVLILPIEICRICTNLNSNLDILTNKLEDENVLLHEALEFVSCIRIDFDDGMSRTMCSTCSKKLLDAYTFKNQILDSYRAFYKQTSDVSFKNDDLNHEDDSGMSVIESNNNIDSKQKDEPALVIERANELGIKLSSDAISFILEQNSCKTRSKRKPSLTLENLVANEQKVTELETDTEEDNGVDIVCTPSLDAIEQTEESTRSPNVETPSIENNQVEYTKPPPIEQTNTKIQPTPNSRPPERNRKASNKKNSKCSTTRNNKTERSKLACHICHKILPKKSNLKDHLRLHANEKNFVCSFCQKAFVQVANYRTHLRVHTKERPYHCHLCPKTYSQAGSLNTHIRSHTNERNHVCEICCKDFTNSSDLCKHKRIHDQSRQFACATCGNLFTQRVNLKVHERNVHFITR